jgi:hypothetical protein
MHQLERVVLASVLALLASCNMGPSSDDTAEVSALHDVVVTNASAVMQESLVDLSEALPHMTTNAEREV